MVGKSVSILDLAAKGLLTEYFRRFEGRVGPKAAGGGPRVAPASTNFFGSLAILMDTGFTLARSLRKLAATAPTEGERQLCKVLLKELEDGSSFLECATKHARYFSYRQLGWLAIAEATGDLEQVLPYLYTYEWVGVSAQLRVLASALYLTVGLGLAALLLVGPWMSAVLIGCVVLLVYRLRRSMEDPKIQMQVFRRLLKVPHLGRLIEAWLTTEFSRALAVQLDRGIRIYQALPLAGCVLGPTLGDSLALRTSSALLTERTLSSSLRSTGFFSPLFLGFVSCAEEVGSVAHMVNWLAVAAESKLLQLTEDLVWYMRSLALLVFAVLLTALIALPPKGVAQLYSGGHIARGSLTTPANPSVTPTPVASSSPSAKPSAKSSGKPSPKATKKAGGKKSK